MANQEDKNTSPPLKDLVDMIGGQDGSTPSWPVLFFLVAGVVIVTAILGIQLALSKRKAAKLLYDLRMKNEELEKAKEAEKLAKQKEERDAAQKRVESLQKEVDALYATRNELKESHRDTAKQLSSITSWDALVVEDKRPIK